MNSILFTCFYWMNIMLNDSCARGTMLNRGQKGQVLFLLACLMAAVEIKTKGPAWCIQGDRVALKDCKRMTEIPPLGEFLHMHETTSSFCNGHVSGEFPVRLCLLWARFHRDS